MERRKFTREFKLEAVRLIKERGVSYVQASQDLECGDDTEVALAIAKDTGKVLGTNVWIKIRLRGKQPDVKRVVGGTIVFREIDDVIAFYRNGKKIECTTVRVFLTQTHGKRRNSRTGRSSAFPRWCSRLMHSVRRSMN
jgi:hypothetical protein